MSSEEFLDCAGSARRAVDLLEQLLSATLYAHQMRDSYCLPDSYPLKGSPEGDEWWRQREAAFESRLEEPRASFGSMMTELRGLKDRLLDAAELPQVRGDGMDLMSLPLAIDLFNGCQSLRVGLPPDSFFIHSLTSQLRRLERRLKHAATSAIKGSNADEPQVPPAYPDGPVPPKGFSYNKKLVEVEPLPCKLLEYLWRDRRARVKDAEQAVWGHEHEPEADGALKSALTRANRAMDEAGCPWSVKKSGEWLTIE